MADNTFKRGLTWKSLLAMITAAILFIPVTIYVNLVMGATAAAAAVYLTAILFGQMARFFGSPLTKQELFIIYVTVGGVAGAIPGYYWLLYRAFFVNTPVTQSFVIDGTPLVKLVPSWLAPPIGSPVYSSFRTLFHISWILPIFIVTVMTVLGFLTEISLALFLSYQLVEREELQFPLATITTAMVTTLSERKTEKYRIFMLAFYPGAMYAFFLFSNLIVGVEAIPLPWVDLTHVTERVIPGAPIGIATDLGTFLLGFIIPLGVSISMLIGSLLIWVVGNTLFLSFFRQLFPQWIEEYFYGMRLGSIVQRSQLRVWISPQLGFALGLAIMLVINLRKSLYEIFKKSAGSSEWGPSLLKIFGMYFVGTGGSVILYHYLIPEMPMYIPLLASVGLSFLFALVVTMSIAQTGISIVIPWPWAAIVTLSSYQGYAGFVFSPAISLGGCAGTVNATRAAYLTETNPRDYYKALVISLILNTVLGFMFMDFFWRIAPIPSSVYHYTMIYWPLWAMNDCLFATRQIIVDPTLIMSSAGVSMGIFILAQVMSKIGVSFLPIPLIMGFYTIPPYAVTIFIGSIIAKYVARLIGRKRWDSIKGTVVSGALAGMGIVAGIAICVNLLFKSSWPWPW